jgi:hypothetical protein
MNFRRPDPDEELRATLLGLVALWIVVLFAWAVLR